MSYFRLLLLIILAILVAVFAANNDQLVTINLFPLPYEFSASFFLIIFISILIGVLLGGTALSIKAFYWKRRYGSAQLRADKLESKIVSSESKDLIKK